MASTARNARAAAGRNRRPSSGFDDQQAEAPDDQFVAVLEAPPLDNLVVDEDAVEAAVVEHPKRLAVFGDDKSVPTRDAGIVEAEVRGCAASDSGPAGLEREDLDLVVIVEVGEEAAGAREQVPDTVMPARLRRRGRSEEFVGRAAVLLPVFEDRVEAERRCPALGAFRKAILLVEGQMQPALYAKVSTRPRERTAGQGLWGIDGRKTG